MKKRLTSLERTIAHLKEKEAEKAAEQLVNEENNLASVIKTGAAINSKYSMVTTLEGGYDESKHISPRNADGELTWTKPYGGLWLATQTENGDDGWNRLLGDGEANPVNKTAVTFKDDAKVAVITNKEDYRKILDAYPHYQNLEATSDTESEMYGSMVYSSINPDGTSRRGIDYEAMSKDYDAVFVTWQGLGSAGRFTTGPEGMGTDVSLYIWDIESVFVLNKDAIKTSPTK